MKSSMKSRASVCAVRISLVLFVMTGFPLLAQSPNAKGHGLDKSERQRKMELRNEALKYRRLRLQDEKGEIPTNALVKAWEQKKRMQSEAVAGSRSLTNQAVPSVTADIGGVAPSDWRWLGPGNIGGRVRSILIHPTMPTTMWIGSVGGGVWKTTTSGESWFPLTDFMANLAIGCMALDPANPNVLYAGTGESFAVSDANGFEVGDGIQGAGIFKTVDGGNTWFQLTNTAGAAFTYVNRLAIRPGNSQMLLAATGNGTGTGGIYQSTDGGTNWRNSSFTHTLDVEFDPTDGARCIASGTGSASYSTDAGTNWAVALGLPGADRIEVAYAPNSPNTVYAYTQGDLYRSLNGGRTFTRRGGTDETGGNYNNSIWVDPTDSERVIVGGIELWRTDDGGITFVRISSDPLPHNLPNSIHADHHVIVSHPQFDGIGNKTVLFGNDGGVFRADNVYDVNVFTSPWTELNNGLGITQFYGVAGNPNGGTIIGGTQDNGTERYLLGADTESWTIMEGGDGGFCAVDSTDNTLYGEYIHLAIYRSTDGGNSVSRITNGISDAWKPPVGVSGNANFIAPFILDPNNPRTMLAGGRNLWRCTDVKAATPTWSSIAGAPDKISAIAVAPGNSDIIWFGCNNGVIFATSIGTAPDPSSSWQQKDKGTPTLPGRFCTRIAIDPNDSRTVYVTFGGFSSDNIWRTTDGGTRWEDITGNLPDIPVNSLVMDPHITRYLYIGTELGVFASINGGKSWSPANDGPANVVVDELSWMGDILLAATHGRGCYLITPIAWVQFGAPSGGNGTFYSPYGSLTTARDFVLPGTTVVIKGPAQTTETLTTSKRMSIDAWGGDVTIGLKP